MVRDVSNALEKRNKCISELDEEIVMRERQRVNKKQLVTIINPGAAIKPILTCLCANARLYTASIFVHLVTHLNCT